MLLKKEEKFALIAYRRGYKFVKLTPLSPLFTGTQLYKIIEEFKEFAIKGNMIDIAVGVIVGASFNKVVDVLVKQIFLPPLSFLTDGINWQNKRLVLRQAVVENGITKPEEISIGYGALIEASVDFLIVTFTVFIVVKLMNSLRRKADDVNDKTVKTPKDIELLHRTVELLEQQNKHLMKEPSDK